MKATMRTQADRIRHAILFEAILLGICTPVLSTILNHSMETIGLLGIGLSTISTLWNYVYNYLFDHALLRLNKPLYPRKNSTRIIHALFFEVGLLFVTIPAVMYLLDYTFIHAIMVDLGFIVTMPFYALAFNYLYDRAFPVSIAKAC